MKATEENKLLKVKKPKEIKKTINGDFSKSQLAILKKHYSAIEKVNPEGEAMQKLNKFISSLTNDSLQMLIAAKIKWVSSKASIEIILREQGDSLA